MKKIHQNIPVGVTAILSLLLLTTAISCKKENAIVKSDEDARLYKLPQGDQPYDQQIVDFYNKYHTVILYNYVRSDFDYNFTSFTLPNISAPAAGPIGIQQTLNFLQEQWFSMYPDAFLKKGLPLKILLSSRISKIPEQGTNSDLPAIAGYRNVTFGLTGKLDNLTPGAIDTARGALHDAFWQQAFANNTIELPPTFPSLSTYPSTAAAMKQAGTFFSRQGMTMYHDAGDYMKVITSKSRTWLDANLFTPQNDPNGNFKKKYDILVNYYQTKYNVDLQAIGNL